VRRRFLGTAFLGLAAAAATAAPASEDKLPRRELAPLERALAAAVSEVSRPAAVPVLGSAEVCRGYRLPGFGALFVVSPRSLPERVAMRNAPESEVTRAARQIDESIAGMQESLKTAETDEEKQKLAAGIAQARRHKRQMEERFLAQQQAERELQAFELQVQAMHMQAQRERQQAERLMMDLARRLGAPVADVRAPSGETVVSVGSTSHQAPPWMYWLQESSAREDSRSPEQVMDDVRQTLMTVICEHGTGLDSLEPGEVVSVAVDFYRGPTVGAPGAPSRTLVLRVPKSVLDELRGGKLTPDAARKQFQIAEY
jgi:hypothetical protein